MKKILVVDDERPVCDMLKKFLTMKGYEAIVAYGSEEALIKMKEEKPDAVLLDIIMPDMDGIRTLEKMREVDPKIVIVMITAVKDPEAGRRCIELGAKDYITKPFSLSYLERVLEAKLADLL